MSPDLAASIQGRLLQAKEPSEAFERTPTRFAAERLFRLGASARATAAMSRGSFVSF
jgi:hypothetical protein